MQFQSSMAQIPLAVPDKEELSAIGAAYMAGLSAGIYTDQVFKAMQYRSYQPAVNPQERERKYAAWKRAVGKVLHEK
jgi:glycerol kinase